MITTLKKIITVISVYMWDILDNIVQLNYGVMIIAIIIIPIFDYCAFSILAMEKKKIDMTGLIFYTFTRNFFILTVIIVDILLFCDGEIDRVRGIIWILQHYCSWTL